MHNSLMSSACSYLNKAVGLSQLDAQGRTANIAALLKGKVSKLAGKQVHFGRKGADIIRTSSHTVDAFRRHLLQRGGKKERG